MSNKGFDTGSDCSHLGQAILDAGFTYICRYTYSITSHSKTKLSRAEALHLSGMGIFLVNVFQNSADKAAYFQEEQGIHDGSVAFPYARQTLQQPIQTPIYFAVDYDASEEDIRHRIAPYFEGVRRSRGAYFVGVYGSGLVCRVLKELGLVSFTWLSQSTGFRESKTFHDWNLHQLPGGTFHSLDVDFDESNGNGGGFLVK